jgi:SAM-dependent methyltransferase
MGRETWSENLQVMDALGIDRSDHILDLGCARARSGRTGHPRLDGRDATGRSSRPPASTWSLASVESLPFADDFFDKVLCVHVLYFWKDLDASLREIARVLKSGSRLNYCSGPKPTRQPSHRFRRRSIAFRRSSK